MIPVPPKPPLAPQLGGAIGGAISGALGASSSGESVQAAFGMDAGTTFDALAYAVSSNNGQVKFTQPPSSLSFETSRRAVGLNVRYEGLIQVASMAPQQSAVRVQLQPVKGTLTPLFYVGAILSLFMMFMWWITLGLGLFGLLLGIVATGAQYYALANTAPREMAEKIVAAISSGPAPDASKATSGARSLFSKLTSPPAFVSAFTNQAATPSAPAAAAPAAAPVALPENPIFEQLKQLGNLRDAGILTTEEFDRKKAELLARL